jgi:hypothetical protein
MRCRLGPFGNDLGHGIELAHGSSASPPQSQNSALDRRRSFN